MVLDVVEVLKGIDIFVIVDGGICFLGDIVKVFVVGVSCVMVGSMLVGMEELLGEVEFF